MSPTDEKQDPSNDQKPNPISHATRAILVILQNELGRSYSAMNEAICGVFKFSYGGNREIAVAIFERFKCEVHTANVLNYYNPRRHDEFYPKSLEKAYKIARGSAKDVVETINKEIPELAEETWHFTQVMTLGLFAQVAPRILTELGFTTGEPVGNNLARMCKLMFHDVSYNSLLDYLKMLGFTDAVVLKKRAADFVDLMDRDTEALEAEGANVAERCEPAKKKLVIHAKETESVEEFQTTMEEIQATGQDTST